MHSIPFLIVPMYRKSRSLIESTLSNINQSTVAIRQSSLNLERRISVLESCINSGNKAEREESNTPTAFITGQGMGNAFVRLEYATRDTTTHTTPFHCGSSRYLVAKEVEKRSLQEDDRRTTQHSDKIAAPATPFELSSSFFPETYTIRESPPTLVTYALESVEETSYTRVSRCSAFYSPSPRKWLRITLSITTSCNSPYWDLIRFKTAGAKWVFHWSLPKKLHAAVQRSLGYLDGPAQDSELGFYLGHPSPWDGETQPLQLKLQAAQKQYSVRSLLVDFTSSVRHWCCPRYCETDIVKRPLGRTNINQITLARIGSRWVSLTRMCSRKKQTEATLYALRALHYCRDAPGISRLLGIVYDADDGILTGFLSEAPATSYMFRSELPQKRGGVSWHFREKICWQIIRTLAGLHDAGFVAGMLADPIRNGMCVDSYGDLLINGGFQPWFHYNEETPFVVPPEQHASAVFDSTGRCLPASPCTDLYQLGLLLWRVAAGLNCVRSSSFCRLAHCRGGPNGLCRESHANPIRLPLPDPNTPPYLSQIIEICRSVDPLARDPAWSLLELFPSSADHSWNKPMRPSQTCGEGLDVAAWMEQELFCDICESLISQHHYHCSTCKSANFDVCESCFAKGAHCFNSNHLLQEMPQDDYDAFYTCVGVDGKRGKRLSDL